MVGEPAGGVNRRALRGPRKPGSGGGKSPRFAGSTKPSQPTALPSRPKTAGPAIPIDVHDPDGVRLQKLLAAAGITRSRSEMSTPLAASRALTVPGASVTFVVAPSTVRVTSVPEVT